MNFRVECDSHRAANQLSQLRPYDGRFIADGGNFEKRNSLNSHNASWDFSMVTHFCICITTIDSSGGFLAGHFTPTTEDNDGDKPQKETHP